MRNCLLVKTLTALTAISASRIVVQVDDAEGAQAGVDLAIVPFGVSDPAADVAIGESCDVITHGIESLVYGGALAHGDPVTSDAQGRGIKAEPAPGQTVAIVGFAVLEGDEGVIGSVRLAPGLITGAAA